MLRNQKENSRSGDRYKNLKFRVETPRGTQANCISNHKLALSTTKAFDGVTLPELNCCTADFPFPEELNEQAETV